MLIVLGIAVLAVSFVVALFSLVAEERKRERLNAQANALPDTDNQVSGGGSSQAVWGLKTPADNPTEPKTAASRAATDEDVFPWEQSKTAYRIEEEDARYPNLSGPKDPLENGSSAQDLGQGKSLSGEIKISDIGKKREE